MKRYHSGTVFLWVMLFLLANGIGAFVYSAYTSAQTRDIWVALAINFVFFLGITQTGIVFSAIMRIAKSKWSTYFNRLGEVMTLSFIPLAVITLIIIYLGGGEKLFYWFHGPSHVGGHEGVEHLSPWLDRRLFVWRYVILMVLFYVFSIIYFRGTRKEEEEIRRGTISDAFRSRMNILASLVMFFYVWLNTNVAWDFGMMIIKHWESTIFPAYFWVGNVFAGTAFLFLMARLFIARAEGEVMHHWYLDSMGKLLLAFCMLWIYMFWSLHIVTWYAELPHIYGPLERQMSGNYGLVFTTMIFTIFVIPFLALIFRKIKLSEIALSTVAIIICCGVWLNRYLMITPVFFDGSTPVLSTYTGISVTLGLLAATILSIVAFFELFPGVSIRAGVRPGRIEYAESDEIVM